MSGTSILVDSVHHPGIDLLKGQFFVAAQTYYCVSHTLRLQYQT